MRSSCWKESTTTVSQVGDHLEIAVSKEMIDAGVAELSEHSFASDWREILESVFRAMAYASLESSNTRSCK